MKSSRGLRVDAPVLIVGCARSGTSLLFQILSEVSHFWSCGYESGAIIERWHHPSMKAWDSGCLTGADLTLESRTGILRGFQREIAPGMFWRRANTVRGRLGRSVWGRAVKKRGRFPRAGSRIASALPGVGLAIVRSYVRLRNRFRSFSFEDPVRLVEKTPENCLRLPFLLRLFPGARVVFLTRDGPSNIRSLMDGWKHPHLFPGYVVPEELTIAGITRQRWAFTLIPGWRDLVDQPLVEVCAHQWFECNRAVLDFHRRTTNQVPWHRIRLEELVSDPDRVLGALADFVDLDSGNREHFGRIATDLPRVNTLREGRRSEKEELGQEMGRVAQLIQPMMQRLGYT